MTSPYTVLGAGGFIGGALVRYLRAEGHRVDAPPRSDEDALLRALSERDLGHIIYCIGLTADFRTKPFETVSAHTTLLARILERCSFRSLVYLSSTRVYAGAARTGEDAALQVDPRKAGDLYNLSKLLGESLCLASGKPCRVARLSNVFGPGSGTDNFIGAIVADAARNRRVVFQTSPDSEKDYVALDDVVRWLAALAVHEGEPIYNLASGRNTSNKALADALTAQGVACTFAAGAPTVSFPRIDTTRLVAAFGAPTQPIERALGQLIASISSKES